MEKQTKRLILLFSLILVIIPMVIFPNRLGMPLISGSAIYMLYEIIFYAAVLYLFRRPARLTTILMGAALTMVYRMALGAAFGLSIIVMYSMDSTIAFSLGMGKYLPAVILHVLAAPFVIRSVYMELAENMAPDQAERKSYQAQTARPVIIDQERTVPNPASVENTVPRSSLTTAPVTPVRNENIPSPATHSDDENQFERAVNYLGESATVKMALLVDEEGLILARFNRCQEDIDLWAPLALILEKQNGQLLRQYHRNGHPDKIEIGTKNMRVILRRIEHVILLILTEQTVDEIIQIRIAQATDMVRKYMSERYSPALFARVEERYVSNS